MTLSRTEPRCLRTVWTSSADAASSDVRSLPTMKSSRVDGCCGCSCVVISELFDNVCVCRCCIVASNCTRHSHSQSYLTVWNAQVITESHQTIWSWYTGRWWVGCDIWYSWKGLGWAAARPGPPRSAHELTRIRRKSKHAIGGSVILPLFTLWQGKNERCVAGGGVMASDSEPGKFFSFDPQTPLESRFQSQLTPLENIQKRSK